MSEWIQSLFVRANRLLENGNQQEAFRLFRGGAEAGDSGCMLNLGVLYGDGVSGAPDHERELFWYKKSLARGETSAISNIAISYKEQRRYRKAEAWFNKAIAAGDGDANLELAKLLLSRGTPRHRVVPLLEAAVSSPDVTVASVEEAQGLLNEI